MGDLVRLRAGDQEADLARLGAEPMRWRVGGRELLWHGDPEHWSFRAPLLFPVVGASKGGHVRVEGRAYPMPQHGFARRLPFRLLGEDGRSARLRLEERPETLAAYPFPFRLDVVATLDEAGALSLEAEVTNTGPTPMPYGIGFHPAFAWPFAAPDRSGHRVVFEAAEDPDAPEVAEGGLLARRTRTLPLDGRTLPLDPALFTEALVFLDARSRSLAFEAPSGDRIAMTSARLPHLAVWTRPDAPFLSLEAWSTHADWEDFDGGLAERASITILAPGETGRHGVGFSYRPRTA